MSAKTAKPEKAFLSIPEAAKLLEVHPTTLRKECKERNFPSMLIGKKVRISKAYIESYLAALHTGKAPPEAPEVEGGKKKRGRKPKLARVAT